MHFYSGRRHRLVQEKKMPNRRLRYRLNRSSDLWEPHFWYLHHLVQIHIRRFLKAGEKVSVFLSHQYLFEPDPQEVLNRMLPRLVETMLYQALLESSASEHSARMLAMRNATDAAKEMIDDLTLVFNKARQAAITSELADISGGRAAVE